MDKSRAEMKETDKEDIWLKCKICGSSFLFTRARGSTIRIAIYFGHPCDVLSAEPSEGGR